MEMLQLRAAGDSALEQHFSTDEIDALKHYRHGSHRNVTMFDFAARCHDGDEPTMRHPLGQADAVCTHSTSLKNVHNALHFAAPGGDSFVVVQRVTFMDALIFPSRGVAIIIRSIKESQVTDVVNSLESAGAEQVPTPRAFGGFIVSHQRPYHYFYESLPAMLWFARRVRPDTWSSRKPEVVQLQGGDYMPLNPFFPESAVYAVSSGFLNTSNRTDNTFFVKMGYSGMWDKDKAQTDAIDLLDDELRRMALSNAPGVAEMPERRPGILFDISEAKGTWETLKEDIPVIVKEVMDRVGSEVVVYLDGWTLAATANSKAVGQARDEARTSSAIAASLPQGAHAHSLVGASPSVKMKHMQYVDAAVCRYSTGSMIPSRVMRKPGIVHHSGKASIFKKLHFHGPGMHELVGEPLADKTQMRDQNIPYSLDAGKIVKILGEVLQT